MTAAARCVFPLASALLLGCSPATPPARPTSQPASAPASQPATTAAVSPDERSSPRIVAESAEWGRDEALANLADPQLGLSAAVRLVRIAGVETPLLPTPLSPADAARLRLAELDDGDYVLGERAADAENVLHKPLLIHATGEVVPIGDVGDAVLHLSRDPDVFPHIFLSPRQVILATHPDRTALLLKTAESLRFELRSDDGHDYLALVYAAPGAASVEAAQYAWDPFEHTFSGPASDRLPPPATGFFVLDLDKSAALNPVGGEIAPPDPIKADESHKQVEPS
ncbi:MAG: hypothetical protein CHACPFDD_00463 [Phycisphaerae bacterium]|nr:hypothetical protein [Phycisphaerae bacterium]